MLTQPPDLALFAKPRPARRPVKSLAVRPQPRPVLEVDLKGGCALARTSEARIARTVKDYRPRGVLLRWRHCWFDLNGYFVMPVALAPGRIRHGSGALVVTARAPRAVLATLDAGERARIETARRRFHRALDRVLGRPGA